MVRDLPDANEEVPKSELRGWQFDSWLWNLLFIWWKNQEPTHRKVGMNKVAWAQIHVGLHNIIIIISLFRKT